MNDEIIAALRKEGVELSTTGPTLNVQIDPFPEGEVLESEDIEAVFGNYGKVTQVEFDTKKPGSA